MERPVSANVSQVIAAEFVVDCDVDNQVAVTAEVDVLEHQVTPPHLVVALLDGRDAARISGLEQRDAAMSRVSPQFFYMSRSLTKYVTNRDRRWKDETWSWMLAEIAPVNVIRAGLGIQ